MNAIPPNKTYIDEQQLLEDSFRLGVLIYESGFKPDFLVGLWRGGSSVGIYVQECLQFLGVNTDHISVRTSYRGMEHYSKSTAENIRVHGLQYLFEQMNYQDSLLIVDDVYNSGQNIAALLRRLESKMKRNLPEDIRIAVPFYKPDNNLTSKTPDYYIHETSDWLVFPYELTGLTETDLVENKPWAANILNRK